MNNVIFNRLRKRIQHLTASQRALAITDLQPIPDFYLSTLTDTRCAILHLKDK